MESVTIFTNDDGRGIEVPIDRFVCRVDWTLERLREKGFSEEVLEAIDGVTHRDGESYEDFVKRAQKNPIARRVKIADLEDNMNVRRIENITPKDLTRLEKYHKAWRTLIEPNE